MQPSITISPPERLLTGPGPSNPHPRVLQALGAPVVGHLDPAFLEIMDDTMASLRRLFRTSNAHTIPMSGTGTSALEAIALNLIEPGDEVVVGVIGLFGERLADMAARAGASLRVIEAPYGAIVEPERFENELRSKSTKRYPSLRSSRLIQRASPTLSLKHSGTRPQRSSA